MGRRWGGMTRPVHGALLVVMLLLPTAVTARAQSDVYQSLRRLDRRVVDRAMEEMGLELDPAPAGKRFGQLIVVNRNIFDPDETPWLVWLNHFHSVTPAWVVQQEVLWRQGDLYDPPVVWESMRNLRRRSRLSVVAMVPVVSSDPEHVVDMLVVTRDTFSFHASRETSGFRYTPVWEAFTLPEWNMMGIGWSASMNLVVASDTVTFGPRIGTPDLAGSHVTVLDEVDLVLNYRDGRIEGSQNFFLLGVPLYHSKGSPGLVLAEAHDLGIDRYMAGSQVRTYDNPDTDLVETIPSEFDKRVIDMVLQVFFGLDPRVWHVLFLGPGITYRRYELLDHGVDPATRAAFHRDLLPIDESTGFFSLGYRRNPLHYETVTRYQSFGFSEDIPTGLRLLAELRLLPEALGSSEEYLVMRTDAVYTRLIQDWVLAGSLGGSIRWGLIDGATYDREISGQATVAFPQWSFLRCHLGAAGLWRTARLATPLMDFGEDTGFRGYPAGWFIGDGVIIGQVELRSAPVEILYQLFGLVLFLDLGTVFGEDGSHPFLSDVGLGLRWVIPWYSGIPLRLDYGIPLSGNPSQPYGVLSIGTEQVF